MSEPQPLARAAELPRRLAAVWFADIVGYKEMALELLEKALAARDITVSTFARLPFLDSLRGDPRFDAILERIGLA